MIDLFQLCPYSQKPNEMVSLQKIVLCLELTMQELLTVAHF